MADQDSTQYVNLPSCNDDPVDLLTKKSKQLHALLKTIIGEGFDSFDKWNEDIKHNFLWACAELATDIEELSLLVMDKPA